MVRGLVAGATNYTHQSFEDMVIDLQDWRQSLQAATLEISGIVSALEDEGYWRRVPLSFASLVARALKLFNTGISEIGEVLEDLHREVRADHVLRLSRLGNAADELNRNLGRAWNDRIEMSKSIGYGDEHFQMVERVYRETRSMVGDMIDLSNLAARLEDFVGRKRDEIVTLSPEFHGIRLDLSALFRRIRKYLGRMVV